jgi:hypothetical protein
MAAGQISCSDSFQSVNTRNNLTKREESAVNTAVENTDGFLDILSAVYKLKIFLMAQHKYHYLLTQVLIINCSDKENILRFIYELSAFVSFSNLVGMLHFAGFEDLANRIRNNIGDTCREIGYAELSGSMPFLQGFFYKQKSRLDDNLFHCRKRYLQLLFNKLTLGIRDLVDSDAQASVDKIATVTWLRVQQCEKGEDIKELINEMLNSVPCNVDKTLPRLVFKSKLAIAFELDDDSDTAEILLSEACAISELYSHPLMKAFLFHDTRYIHQLRFMRHQSEENRNKVQADCVQAIDFFSVFENDLCCIYMKRLFSLYLVHNILNVGQNFEIDVSNEISTEEMTRANGILSCLERCFQSGLPLEIRRKMIYLILRTRMHELVGDISIASTYFTQAYSLKDDGTFFGIEEDHLVNFKNRLLPIPAL